MGMLYYKYKYQQDIEFNTFYLTIKYSLNGRRYYKIKIDLTGHAYADSCRIHGYQEFIESIFAWQKYSEIYGVKYFVQQWIREDMEIRKIKADKTNRALEAQNLLKTTFCNRWTEDIININELSVDNLVSRGEEAVNTLLGCCYNKENDDE
jgi:hypothetical protein